MVWSSSTTESLGLDDSLTVIFDQQTTDAIGVLFSGLLTSSEDREKAGAFEGDHALKTAPGCDVRKKKKKSPKTKEYMKKHGMELDDNVELRKVKLKAAHKTWMRLQTDLPRLKVEGRMEVAAGGKDEHKTTIQRVLGNNYLNWRNDQLSTDVPDEEISFAIEDVPKYMDTVYRIYSQRRVRLTFQLVKQIKEDVHAYQGDYETLRRKTTSKMFEKLSALDIPKDFASKHAALIKEYTQDDMFKHRDDPRYIIYTRMIACRTMPLLCNIVCKAVAGLSDACRKTVRVIVPAIKKEPRMIFKAFVSYGGDFNKVRDVSRLTIQVETIEHVVEVVQSLLKQPELLCWRSKNRFAPVYDVTSNAGYRDYQLNCLIKVDGFCRYVEIQVNVRPFVERKNSETGGHEVFNRARAVEAYNEETLHYVGLATEEAWKMANGGTLLAADFFEDEIDVDMMREICTGPCGDQSRLESIAFSVLDRGIHLSSLPVPSWNVISHGLPNTPNTTGVFLDRAGVGEECGNDASIFFLKAIENSGAIRVLCLARNNLGDRSGQMIARALSGERSLMWLDLSWNNLTDVSGSTLCSALEQNVGLRSLILVGNQLGDTSGYEFARVLSVNSTLVHLDLSKNQLSDESFITIIGVIGGNTALKELILAENDFGDNSSYELANAVEAGAFGKLEIVDLRFNKISFTARVQLLCTRARMIASGVELKVPKVLLDACHLLEHQNNHFQMSKSLGAKLDDDFEDTCVWIADHLEANPNIQSLTFEGYSFGRIESLGASLMGGLNLRRLVLDEVELTAANALLIVDYLSTESKLQFLVLANNNLRGKIWEALTRALATNTSLVHLDIHGNFMEASEAEIFCSSLEDGSCGSLRMLDMRSIIVPTQLTTPQLHSVQSSFFRAAMAHPQLKHVLVDGNGFTEQTSETILHMCKHKFSASLDGGKVNRLEYLQSRTADYLCFPNMVLTKQLLDLCSKDLRLTLRLLDLSGSNLSDEGAAILGGQLAASETIVDLIMQSMPNLTLAGWQVLLDKWKPAQLRRPICIDVRGKTPLDVRHYLLMLYPQDQGVSNPSSYFLGHDINANVQLLLNAYTADPVLHGWMGACHNALLPILPMVASPVANLNLIRYGRSMGARGSETFESMPKLNSAESADGGGRNENPNSDFMWLLPLFSIEAGLTFLDLTDLALGPKVGQIIADGLLIKGSIRTLKIAGNLLGADGSRSIAEALPALKQPLFELDARNNDITKEVGHLFLKNSFLLFLDSLQGFGIYRLSSLLIHEHSSADDYGVNEFQIDFGRAGRPYVPSSTLPATTKQREVQDVADQVSEACASRDPKTSKLELSTMKFTRDDLGRLSKLILTPAATLRHLKLGVLSITDDEATELGHMLARSPSFESVNVCLAYSNACLIQLLSENEWKQGTATMLLLVRSLLDKTRNITKVILEFDHKNTDIPADLKSLLDSWKQESEGRVVQVVWKPSIFVDDPSGPASDTWECLCGLPCKYNVHDLLKGTQSSSEGGSTVSSTETQTKMSPIELLELRLSKPKSDANKESGDETAKTLKSITGQALPKRLQGVWEEEESQESFIKEMGGLHFKLDESRLTSSLKKISVVASGYHMPHLRSLVRQGIVLNDKDVAWICDLLVRSTAIAVLDIGPSCISYHGWAQISEAIKVNSSVKEIAADKSKMTTAMLKCICDGIRERLSSIKSVDFSENQLDMHSGPLLNNLLLSCPEISSLVVRNNNLTLTGVSQILQFSDIDIDDAKETREATKVDVRENNLYLGRSRALAGLCGANANAFVCPHGDTQRVAAPSLGLATSDTIVFSKGIEPGTDEFNAIVASKRSGSMEIWIYVPGFASVQLDTFKWSAPSLRIDLKVPPPHASTIVLKNCQLGDTVAQELIQGLVGVHSQNRCHDLQELDLSGNDLGLGVADILGKLAVAVINLNDNKLTDEGGALIIEDLKKNKWVHTIQLANNGLGGNTLKEIKTLLKVKNDEMQLRELHVGYNPDLGRRWHSDSDVADADTADKASVPSVLIDLRTSTTRVSLITLADKDGNGSILHPRHFPIMLSSRRLQERKTTLMALTMPMSERLTPGWGDDWEDGLGSALSAERFGRALPLAHSKLSDEVSSEVLKTKNCGIVGGLSPWFCEIPLRSQAKDHSRKAMDKERSKVDNRPWYAAGTNGNHAVYTVHGEVDADVWMGKIINAPEHLGAFSETRFLEDTINDLKISSESKFAGVNQASSLNIKWGTVSKTGARIPAVVFDSCSSQKVVGGYAGDCAPLVVVVKGRQKDNVGTTTSVSSVPAAPAVAHSAYSPTFTSTAASKRDMLINAKLEFDSKKPGGSLILTANKKRETVDFRRSDVPDTAVLTFEKLTDCTIDLANVGTVLKIRLFSCQGCKLLLPDTVKITTSFVEVWDCTGLEIAAAVHIGTLQVDSSENVAVDFASTALIGQVVHAGAKALRITFIAPVNEHDVVLTPEIVLKQNRWSNFTSTSESAAESGAVDISQGLSEGKSDGSVQFITRLIDKEMLTEKIIRFPSDGFPTTERESTATGNARGSGDNVPQTAVSNQTIACCGDECMRKIYSDPDLTITHPICRGVVTDWEGMEHLFHHLFYNELKVAPEKRRVLVTEPALNPKMNRTQLLAMLFETFNVPAAYVAIDAVLTLYASGRTTGLVLQSGTSISTALPIYEGYLIPHGVVRYDLAGNDVTDYLATLLIKAQKMAVATPADWHTVERMKENLAYVALDYELEQSNYSSTNLHDKTYELDLIWPRDSNGEKVTDPNILRDLDTSPDKDSPAVSDLQGKVLDHGHTRTNPKRITLGAERFQCTEILFNPDLARGEGSTPKHRSLGLQDLVKYSIMKCDVDTRKDLYANTVLAGGTTMFPGIADRMQKEITAISPSTMKIKVIAPPERKYSKWIGGMILASSYTFQNLWVSRTEWNEHGMEASGNILCYA